MFPDENAPYLGTFVKDSCVFFDSPVDVVYPGNNIRRHKVVFYISIYLQSLRKIPKVDTLVFHYPLFFAPLVIVGRMLGKRVILAYHGGEFMHRPNRGRFFNWIRKVVFRVNNKFATELYVPSRHIIDSYFSKWANKTVAWYSGGIELTPLEQWPNHRNWSFAYLGRRDPVKGMDCYLDAVQQLGVMTQQLTECLAVSRDTLKPSKSVFNNIELTRIPALPPSEVREHLLNTQFTVIPSRNESLCLLALEAASNGSIVIARSLPAIHETLGASAIYFENDDELVSTMKSALEMPTHEREKLQRNAYKRVVTYSRPYLMAQLRNA